MGRMTRTYEKKLNVFQTKIKKLKNTLANENIKGRPTPPHLQVIRKKSRSDDGDGRSYISERWKYQHKSSTNLGPLGKRKQKYELFRLTDTTLKQINSEL